MSRNLRKRSSNGQVAPIVDQISQIVIYDKPNKPQVPKEILQQSKNLKLGQGDIVLTRQDPDFAKPIAEKNVKREAQDVEEEEKAVNIKTENSTIVSQDFEEEEDALEDLIEEDPLEDVPDEEDALDEDVPEEDVPEEVALEDLPEEEPLVESPPTFKKPRGRPKIPKKTVTEATSKQKCTVLNFIMKHPINPEIIVNNDADVANDNEEGKRQPRLRKRPARFNYEEAEEHYTIDTNSAVLKKKKNSQVSITPIYRTEQTEDPEEEPPTSKNDEKPTKKQSKNPPAKKKPTKLKKNIKEEYDEEQPLDTSNEDNYESEDSRPEWVPEELAELKQQHIMKLIKTLHKCKFCPMEFTTYYGLRKHRVIDHDDMGKVGQMTKKYSIIKEADEAPEEESDEEGRGEWMPEDYAEYKVKHKSQYGYRYKCKICLLRFASYYQLSKHKLEHESQANPYQCKYCPESFSDMEVFTAHIRIHQGKDPYSCKKCSKSFATKEELDAHVPVHILKKAPALPKRYRCDVCGKEFAKLGDVERHTRVHTGEKPVQCNICHKRFQQQHNLTKHLLIHLHVKPFQCEICNKKFGRIDVLNRHLLTHSMEKPFKCELCNKGFIRHHQLTSHNGKAHPEMDFIMEDENRMMLENMTGEMTVHVM